MLVSDKIKNDRRKVCNSCEFKSDSFKIFGITIFEKEPQCQKCKCLINKKTMFDFAECPQNKWEK